MRNMDAFPPEIQMLIFSFACACMDDGSTGRSLSRVSRAIRDLSYPYMWNSLAIYGYAQAEAFAKLLHSQPFGMLQRPRPILNLLITTRPAHSACDRNVFVDTPPTWPGVLRSILRHAAPSLKTLAIICFEPPLDCATMLSCALHVQYPALVELTIRGRCTPSQLSLSKLFDLSAEDGNGTPDGPEGPNYGEAPLEPTWPSIPTLRRLHIACTFQGLARGTHAENALIAQLAPSLTHLRLSVLDLWGSKRLAEVVHAECAESGIVGTSVEVLPAPAHPRPLTVSLGTGQPATHPHPRRFSLPPFAHVPRPRPNIIPPKPAPRTPAHIIRRAVEVTWDRILPPPDQLELFALQPPPTEHSAFYCSCCMDVRGDSDIMRVFEALARSSDERFLFLPLNTGSVYGFAEAQADWLERIAGRPGCWAARREEAERHDAGETADTAPDGEEEQAVGPRTSRKHKRISTLLSPMKQLQKAKFW